MDLPKVVLLSSLLLYGQIVSQASLEPVDWFHTAVLDQWSSYLMLWTPRENDILIEVQVATKGYVGLGFSPTGGMKGADIVLGWIDEEGIIHLTDRFAYGSRTPSVDEKQDYVLHGGYKNDSHSVLRFSRPWLTCDSQQDLMITEDTMRVIWAYDDVIPRRGSTQLQMHDHRGTRSLYLKQPRLHKPDTTNVKNWDVRAPEVSLPNGLTTLYWCKLFKAPALRKKHHVIGYLPLIEEASVPHVHHMLLYECSLRKSEKHLQKWIGLKGAQCYSKNMPISWSACHSPIVVWAIGGSGENFPDHVGFPIGEEHGGSTYFLLEVHYDNPNLKRGITDKSGFRLLYTDELRQHDAGILTLGHKVEPTQIIPPGRLWTSVGHCTSGCTENTLPKDGIRVISGVLHAHLLGSEITLQHIRSGKELPHIIKDQHYDFNYQQARTLSEEAVIKPGDHLITKCTYDAASRRKVTFGGFGTDDEMCLVFLSYYPRQKIGECYSRPDFAMLLDTFGIKNIYNNDEVMSSFNDGAFSEDYIDESDEQERLKQMMSSDKKEGAQLKLAYFLHQVRISEPPYLEGLTLFDLLMNDTIWEDEKLVNALHNVITKENYEPSCLYTGRTEVQGLPKKARQPPYVSFKPPAKTCTQGINVDSYSAEHARPLTKTASPLGREHVPVAPSEDNAADSQPAAQRESETRYLQGRNSGSVTVHSVFLLILHLLVLYRIK